MSGADYGIKAAVKAGQFMTGYAKEWPINTLWFIGTKSLEGRGSGGPFAIWDAAGEWFSAADNLGQAKDRLTQLTEGLPAEDWTGTDREAFNTETSELAQQIGDAQLMAQIVGGTLAVSAVPLATWPVGCISIGVIQVINANAFRAAVASVVGNLGASEALYAEGLAAAVACNTAMRISCGVLLAAFTAAGAVVSGSALANANSQEDHGDEDAKADLLQAAVPGDWKLPLFGGGDSDSGPFSGKEPETPPGISDPPKPQPSDPPKPHEPPPDKPGTMNEPADPGNTGGPPGPPGGPGGPGPGPGGPGPGPGPGPGDLDLDPGDKDQDDKGDDKDKDDDDKGDDNQGDDSPKDKDVRQAQRQLDLVRRQLEMAEQQLPPGDSPARDQIERAQAQITQAQHQLDQGQSGKAMDTLQNTRDSLTQTRDNLTGAQNQDARAQLDAALEQIDAAQETLEPEPVLEPMPAEGETAPGGSDTGTAPAGDGGTGGTTGDAAPSPVTDGATGPAPIDTGATTGQGPAAGQGGGGSDPRGPATGGGVRPL